MVTFILSILVFVFIIILIFSKRVTDLIFLLFFFFFLLTFFLTCLISDFLAVRVSVHKEIDTDVPFLVAWDVTSKLLDFTSEKPEHIGNGVARLVVGRDGNVNPVERGVRVA